MRQPTSNTSMVEDTVKSIPCQSCSPFSETQRSDGGGLAEAVERALCGTGHAPLRAVIVTVCAGVVTLKGLVPTYHLKQLAQSAALRVDGIGQLHNDIEVS